MNYDTKENAAQFVEFPEHSEVVEAGEAYGEVIYRVKELDAYCIVDKDKNCVWMNKDGDMHRLLGPATNVHRDKNNVWAIDGDIVRGWDDYEQKAGNRVDANLLKELKDKYGSSDDVFNFY